MARTKGVALLNRIQILKETYGEETLEEVLAGMKPENSSRLSNLLFSSWYDAEIYRDMNRSIHRVLSGKYPNINEIIGELTAESSLKGVYSSRVKENNVKLTLERTSVLWKSFHDTGELEVELDEDNNHAVLRITGYELPHRELFENLVGWGRRLIELSGGRNPVVKKTKCAASGDPYTELTADWD